MPRPARRKRFLSTTTDLSPDKARKILHDRKDATGKKKLTKRARGFLGAVSSKG